ncbi:MAG: type I phosphomannose isomerase catalytic subunit, partial [Planctomycetaceae bacterium]
MTPLRFRPLIKRTCWGGSRLGSVLKKTIGVEHDYAESWEISDHGTSQSVVAGGPFDGKTLRELVSENNAELFGRHCGLQQFPLLVKFLDAADRLSVQVHPNDVLAEQLVPGENGKTESWVIIDAEPGAVIYAGLKENVDRVQLQQHLAEGTVATCLHSIRVQAGDCFLIPAGTVHAIGEGILLAEIQQTSDLTFRLYDWNRVGSDGQLRALHIEQSLQCIDFARGPVAAVTPRPIVEFREDFGSSYETVELVDCPCFTLHRHRGAAAFSPMAGNCFHALLTLQGHGHLVSGEESFSLSAGESILIPAASSVFQIVPDGEMTVLDVFLPGNF